MKLKYNKFYVCSIAVFICVLLYITGKSLQPISCKSTGSDNAVSSLANILITAMEAAKLGGSQIKRMSLEMNSMNVRTKGQTLEGMNDPVTDADMRSHCAMWQYFRSNIHPDIRMVSEEETDNDRCSGLLVDNIETEAFRIRHDNSFHDISDEKIRNEDITIWIDPLDATQEFTEKLFEFVTVMVCVVIRGQPTQGVIYNPFTDQLHWGWNRKSHSSIKPPALQQNSESISSNNTIIVSRSHRGTVSSLVQNSFGPGSQIIYAGGAGYKVIQLAHNNADAYIHTTYIKKWDLCAGNAIVASLDGHMTDLRGEPIDYSQESDVVHKNGVLASFRNHAAYISLVNKWI